MDQVKEYINQIGMRNIAIIFIVVAVMIIIYIVQRAMRLRKYRSLIVEYENNMNAIKSLPLQYRLGRVQSISKNMKEIVPLYDEYVEEYDRISLFQKNELSVLMNEVDEQLFYGKLRKIASKMNQLDDMLKTYEKDSKTLLAKIEEITEIENVQRVEIIRVKENYRRLIDRYETIRFQLESYIPQLAQYFNNIDDSFVQLEDLMNNQRFDDAKEFTADIDKRVTWLDERIDDLPHYVALVKQYIPKKLDALNTMMDEMSQNNFALNQLDAYQRLEVMNNTLKESQSHIKQLELDGVGEVLQSLVESIDALIDDLDNEQKAYEDFKQKWNKAYDTITNIYEQYKQALKDYHRIKDLYVVDEDELINIEEKYEDFDKILKESYELEEEMNQGEFAYSKMINKVVQMENNAISHEDDLNTFFSYRDQLFLKEQRAIDELENINIVLLEIKSEIKNKHLPMINESYKDYIQDSYDKAAQIQAYRNNRPIELSELSKRVDNARDIIYKLYDNVHNLIVTAEMVEEAIVFGNRYRSTFLEVNTELTKAEVLFRNGEYTKALSTAVEIIEKIQPGSYEELIKNSSVKA
ncbi:MAG: septation ring formation regulator EzrA [Erysipelotrichaceae bacterium]|nr:septation ring formation regulator EzrA [Erysipelotrichaceae bacterium]